MGYIVDGWTKESHPIRAIPARPPGVLCKVSSEAPGKSISGFTTEELAAWLKERGVDDSICDIFQGEDIDGQVLLTCTHKDLEDIGVGSADDRAMVARLIEAF